MKESAVILADCFDTLIFRREHPLLLLKDWAKSVSRLYPNINAEDFYRARLAIAKKLGENWSAEQLYNQMYDTFADCFAPGERKSVTDTLHRLEILCEMRVQSLCTSAAAYLRQQKTLGKRIICVSDFHLPAVDLAQFFERLGISDLFDQIFVSSEEGFCKADGSLYVHVLNKIGCLPSDCIMMGDNRHADCEMAKKSGIKSIYRPHKIRQIVSALRWRRDKNRTLSIPFSAAEALEQEGKQLFRTSDAFEEYSVLLLVFCARLYRAVQKAGGKRIVFLAREGHFLRRCFEVWQELCVPVDARLETDYFKISRRAAYSVQDDRCEPERFSDISLRNYLKSIGLTEADIASINWGGVDIDVPATAVNDEPFLSALRKEQEIISAKHTENKEAFSRYLKDHFDSSPAFLVDVGWNGRMQQVIAKESGQNVKGFYLGIYGRPIEGDAPDTQGLIFHKLDGRVSPYYDLLRANTQIYEQFLAAPHGSALCYRFAADGSVLVEEDWDSVEQALYENCIGDLQKVLLRDLSSVCTHCFGETESVQVSRVLGNLVLRSALVQSPARTRMLQQMNRGFVRNFGQEARGLHFRAEDVEIKPIEIILSPWRYTRFFAKLPLKLQEKRVGLFGTILCRGIYVYERLLLHRYSPADEKE